MKTETHQLPRKLGQGRSAEVYLDRDADGRTVVRKIFRGERISQLVLLLLTGAANPYTWCQAAIRAAFARRKILELLVSYWFGTRLRLPRTFGWRWNRGHRAYELECELIDGRHAPLLGPREAATEDPLHDLVSGVMRPLQRHLAAAGFDGLVWQAGRGNPVAASNFMLEQPAATGDAAGRLSWAWIDLESGVPALFAMNPLATLGFYLPKSLHHRRWLFDDVDVLALRRYLEQHRADIEQAIGREALPELLRQVADLDHYQDQWRSIPRHRRSIAYELSQGRISTRQAEHFASRPVRWTARLIATGAARGARRLATRASRQLARLLGLDVGRLARKTWRFAASQRYRARLARRLVAVRLFEWTERRFLDSAELRCLLRQLKRDDASSYLTDFAVHLMLKPAVKTLQWLAVPAAVAAGWLDLTTAVVLMVGGGLFVRTLYTCGRLAQAVAGGQRRPWVALGVGLLPVVGNAAYPAQLLHSSTEENGELARFMLYDASAAIGRALPVWGGADS